MEAAQGRMQRKLKQFQNKPGGNVKQMQRQLETDQQAMLREGLEFTQRLEPFRKWSLLMGRQIGPCVFNFTTSSRSSTRQISSLPPAVCGAR